MNKMIISVGLLVLAVTAFTGCKAEKSTSTIFEKIDAKQAKEMMDQSDDIIILDVRTEDEFNDGHIKGTILIPDYEIEDKAEEILTDKSATILVYCRSGKRSAKASLALQELGYTKIYDFGGIIDWPYDIVTE